MADEATEALQRAWEQQRLWSQTANRLKNRIGQARLMALCLAIATAILAVAAVQVTGWAPWAGRILAATGAITAGVGTIVQRRVGTTQVSAWTRARSASEGVKSEVYQRLAGGRRYTSGNPDLTLSQQVEKILKGVSELQRHTLRVTVTPKPLPKVHDVATYITNRVDDQITRYYRPRAHDYETRVRRLRLAGDVLGALAVVFGAVAAAFGITNLAAWVPVVTTVGAALVAHIAANRYDHQIIEFLRTAAQLEYLRDNRVAEKMIDSTFVDACEDVISVENQGWMTRWTATDDS
jgi:hypothetical protein